MVLQDASDKLLNILACHYVQHILTIELDIKKSMPDKFQEC